jgi:hypothetical protein
MYAVFADILVNEQVHSKFTAGLHPSISRLMPLEPTYVDQPIRHDPPATRCSTPPFFGTPVPPDDDDKPRVVTRFFSLSKIQ